MSRLGYYWALSYMYVAEYRSVCLSFRAPWLDVHTENSHPISYLHLPPPSTPDSTLPFPLKPLFCCSSSSSSPRPSYSYWCLWKIVQLPGGSESSSHQAHFRADIVLSEKHIRQKKVKLIISYRFGAVNCWCESLRLMCIRRRLTNRMGDAISSISLSIIPQPFLHLRT
jgi:hypothetical protein